MAPNWSIRPAHRARRSPPSTHSFRRWASSSADRRSQPNARRHQPDLQKETEAMASLDVFNADPFTTIQLTQAVERVPYLPQGLAALELFDPKPIRTKVLMVEQRQGRLVILPFSDRGAPGVQRQTEVRSARHFQVPRIRMEDTIYADEIAAIRE